MRAIVLGGAGMLGRAVAAEMRQRRQQVWAPSHQEADICDRQRLLEQVEAFRPGLIVNCAAFTQVDACEEQRDKAFAVNDAAVAHVVEAAERTGAELIQISTDYVFDGAAGTPYAEDAPTGPISVYGESKLQGERRALRYPRALALRASWLFGPGGPNFVVTMRRLIQEGRLPLIVVDDQIGCPTYTEFLARAIADLAPLGIHGILHYRNREPDSWHGFATEIARLVDPGAEVLPVATEDFNKDKDPPPAPRPPWSVLDVTRFEDVVGRRVEPWASGLATYLELLGNDS